MSPASVRRITPVHIGLMLALTFSTGLVDAVGYLGYDKVFTGNMTGNVALLGMGLMGAEGIPVLRPALAIAGFMCGARIGGWVLRGNPPGVWTARTTGVLGSVAAGCAVLTGVLAFGDPHGSPIVGTVAMTSLAGLMGAQAAAARKIGVTDITTVAVTSTIINVATEARTSAIEGDRWPTRLLGIGLLLAGAAVGALTLLVSLWLGVALTTLIIACVAVIGHRQLAGERPHRETVEV